MQIMAFSVPGGLQYGNNLHMQVVIDRVREMATSDKVPRVDKRIQVAKHFDLVYAKSATGGNTVIAIGVNFYLFAPASDQATDLTNGPFRQFARRYIARPRYAQ
jgi:hypothetical protein